MSGSDDLAGRLSRRISAFLDPKVRAQYVGNALREIDPMEAADVLTRAIHAAEARDHEHGALLLSASLALADEANAELRAAVVSAALLRGHLDTANLLQPQPPAKLADDERKVPDFGKGRPVTLGERKSLARGRDRNLLARILRDPHPDVIRILLGNPALTENDVLHLCASRPIAPEVLREVFRSVRWMVRYRIRHAIVRNPFAPVDIALQLALHLNAQDARQAYASHDLAPTVRQLCRRVAGLSTMH